MKTSLLAFVLVTIVTLAFGAELAGNKPKDGFVPDADTAIKIAVAVWEPIYGKEQVDKEKPYRAKLLTGDIWKVTGSHFPQNTNASPSLLMDGGGAMTAEISKDDGRIIRVYHPK